VTKRLDSFWSSGLDVIRRTGVHFHMPKNSFNMLLLKRVSPLYILRIAQQNARFTIQTAKLNQPRSSLLYSNIETSSGRTAVVCGVSLVLCEIGRSYFEADIYSIQKSSYTH